MISSESTIVGLRGDGPERSEVTVDRNVCLRKKTQKYLYVLSGTKKPDRSIGRPRPRKPRRLETVDRGCHSNRVCTLLETFLDDDYGCTFPPSAWGVLSLSLRFM